MAAAVILIGGGLVAAKVSGLLGPSKGSLLVTVSSPSGAAVDTVDVLVDGARACQAVPCRVELAPGQHFVKATAPGFDPSTTETVTVTRGDEKALSLSLAKSQAAVAAAAAAAKPSEPVATSVDALAAAPAAGGAEPSEKGEDDSKRAATSGGAAPGAATPAKPDKPGAGGPPPAAETEGKGVIRISASPSGNVVVDGKPLGAAPKAVRVSAGQHTVVVIGPSGRKVQVVTVPANGTANVSMKF
ncbi:MAG: PEGA domain-containing protein [Polyangiaceae bacterium]|nr:PEGA domain-containing protein [Polyangiaceae bacterium]